MSAQLHTVIASKFVDGNGEVEYYVKCSYSGTRFWTRNLESAVARLDEECDIEYPDDFREHLVEQDS